MKKIIKNCSFFLMVGLLTSCQVQPNKVELKDYIDESLSFKENFTICSLNDIHLSFLSDLKTDFEYLETVIYSRCQTEGLTKDEAKPDMLVLNGDVFMDANKRTVTEFFKFIDSLNIPFAYTYGNHDLQGLYGETFIDSQIKKCKNSLLKNPKDNVFGDSNYVVNIKDGVNTKWQIYMFDSNTYANFAYDNIHEDQIEWYKKQIRLANGLEENVNNVTSNSTIPSLAYFHIPLEEFEEAWEENGRTVSGKNGASVWRMEEGIGNGGKTNSLFETMTDFRSTVGVICAHDHINNSDFHYSKPGLVNTKDSHVEDFPIRLIYGEKSSRNIYHNPFLMGGVFVTLSDMDNTFKLKRIHVDYDLNAREFLDEDLVRGYFND